MSGAARRIGLISDTHGLLRPSVHQALAGVELILHAGDVGGDEILDELALIAPVEAVFGNTDAPRQRRLRKTIERKIGGLSVHVSHGHELGSPTPEKLVAAYRADVLVYGHTHAPLVARVASPEGAERLVINPGAAGPRRFDRRPSVAVLTVVDGAATAELIALPD